MRRMGQCFNFCMGESPKENVITKTSASNDTSSVTTIRKNLVFSASNRGDVSKYYNVLKVLGEGSMGSVSLAQKKKEFVGGSAYTEKKKSWWFGRVVEKRKDAPSEVIHDANSKLYALKSIILSRVSVSSKATEWRTNINRSQANYVLFILLSRSLFIVCVSYLLYSLPYVYAYGEIKPIG